MPGIGHAVLGVSRAGGAALLKHASHLWRGKAIMSIRRNISGACLAIATLGACASAQAQGAAAHEARAAPAAAVDVYAPYEFLIGDWDTGATGAGPAQAVQHFRWGPSRSYLWYSVETLESNGPHLHFEGMVL